MTQEILDDYRPYYDSEVPAAVQRIAQDLYFQQIAHYLFPEKDLSSFVEEFKKIKTVKEFQEKIMDNAIGKVVQLTITNLTCSGVEALTNDKSYMYIANHRDIVLDSAILQTILYANGVKTSEITFGSNLMKPQIVVDIGKINKMFKIVRGGTPREIFVNSLNVSEYMRHAITEKHESTWIAQRNGRTKDGLDKTEIAVLKMFAMSSKKTFAENLGELNITPIAVSYEYEPCDFLKTRERYISRRQTYIKEPGEDLNSILHGIRQFKGNTHYTVCPTITAEELAECAALPHAEQYKALASLIDKRIYAGYRLWKTNYIAHDMLHNKTDFSEFYNAEDKQKFIEYMNGGLSQIDGDRNELQEIFLGIYANPVLARR
ncbi:acyltransferase [Bacteroidia bacterium]|nr:acyltransferase [Bacteroidia bacterium]